LRRLGREVSFRSRERGEKKGNFFGPLKGGKSGGESVLLTTSDWEAIEGGKRGVGNS